MNQLLRLIIKNTPFVIVKLVLNFVNLFREFEISKHNDKIAIIAPNSLNWIALFIASLITKTNVVIISHRKSISDIKHSICNSNVNHIFTTKLIYNKLKGSSDIRMLMSVMKIFSMGNTFGNVSSDFMIKLFFTEIPNDHYSIKKINAYATIHMEKDKVYDTLLGVLESRKNNEQNNIEMYTPGVTAYQKHLSYTRKEFLKTTFIFKNMFDKNSNILIDNVHYDDWPLLSIASLVYGKNDNNKNKMFFTTESFNELWLEQIQPVLQTYWTFKLFTKFNFLYRWYIERKFKRLYPNVDEFIILNCQISFDKLLLLEKSKINVSTTYGMMESGFITLYNNGRDLLSHSGKLVNNELNWDFFNNSEYPDQIFYKCEGSNYLVAGRKINTVKLSDIDVQLDTYSRLISSHPLVHSTLVLNKYGKIEVTVIIDDKIAETLALSEEEDIYNYVSNIISDASDKVPDELRITNLYVYDRTEKLIRTHNDLLKVYMYYIDV